MPKIEPTSTSTRICEWCAESIPKQALKCPRCTKWRKDIEEDRRNYINRLLGGIIFVASCVVLFGLVWAGSTRDDLFNKNNLSCVWHEKVRIDNNILPPYNYEYYFSIKKFLKSYYGWSVIGFGILSMISGFQARRAKSKLKRKIGSDWKGILPDWMQLLSG